MTTKQFIQDINAGLVTIKFATIECNKYINDNNIEIKQLNISVVFLVLEQWFVNNKQTKKSCISILL